MRRNSRPEDKCPSSNESLKTETILKDEDINKAVLTEPNELGVDHLHKSSTNLSPSQPTEHHQSSSFEENRRISASRDSSLNNDDPKSLGDYSISAASSKHNWSVGKGDDDPSISSIKGDSVSATIADYNRKHRAQQHHLQQHGNNDDRQSKTSAKFMGHSTGSVEEEIASAKLVDDLSSDVNLYGPGTSTGGYHLNRHHSSSSRPIDFVSLNSSSVANVDAFDIIEESSNVSSWEAVSQSTSNNNTTLNELNANASDENSGRGDRRNRRHYHNRRHHKKHSRRREPRTLEQALEIDNLPQDNSVYQIEPIVLRGNGNITLFGLSNSFVAEFPSSLIGRISKEEFDKTMRRVNSLLREQQTLSAKLLLFGGLCCCCSFGFSLVWPSIALKKRSKMSLEKLLASENNRLYSKLGLNWKLSEQRCYSNHAFVEYVLMIEFLPKQNLYLPD